MLLCLSLCVSVTFARKGYVKQQIYVTAFDELDISSMYVATLEKSNSFEIVLEVPEQLMTYARTQVVNEKVIFSFDMDRMSRSERQYLSEHRPYVRIKAPAFRKLNLYGATSMDLQGSFRLDEVELTMSGATSFNAGALNAKKLILDLSGASNAKIGKGETDFLEMDIAGASSCDLSSVEAKRMKMEIAGASKMKVLDLVADELKMEIYGASHCLLSSVESKKLELDLAGASSLKMKAFAENADVEVAGMSKMNWEPLLDKVGECLDIEVSGMSVINANKVRFHKVNREVSGMSKLQMK